MQPKEVVQLRNIKVPKLCDMVQVTNYFCEIGCSVISTCFSKNNWRLIKLKFLELNYIT